MTAIIKSDNNLSKLVADYDAIQECADTTWIVDEIQLAFKITVSHIARLAVLIRRAEELGIESNLDFGPTPFLRKIAYGHMAPEVYVALEDTPRLMRLVSSLPMPEQKKLAAGDPVKVMEFDREGEITNRMVPVRNMTRSQLKQVFGKGHIRSDSEQVNIIRANAQQDQFRSKPAIQQTFTIDKRGRRLVITAPCSFTAADLVKILGDLASPK